MLYSPDPEFEVRRLYAEDPVLSGLPPGWLADNWRMLASQLDEYVEKVRRAQREFPQLTIKLALEVDYLPGHEAWIREQLAKIGVGPGKSFNFKDLSLEECYRLAYENAKDIIACGFDLDRITELEPEFLAPSSPRAVPPWRRWACCCCQSPTWGPSW